MFGRSHDKDSMPMLVSFKYRPLNGCDASRSTLMRGDGGGNYDVEHRLNTALPPETAITSCLLGAVHVGDA